MARKKSAATQPVIKRRMQRYSPDPNVGLTDAQVKEYRANGWDNRPVEAPSKSVSKIIKDNVCTYFNLIFLIVTILLVMVGSFRDLMFLPIIIANTLIGIVQEVNAKRILDKLSVLNSPKASVLRNGVIKVVPADRLVQDDIVIFRPGNQIPADAIVVEGEAALNEALLTGEADEITKKPGDALMSGSFVVSGTCKGRLEKVGEDSYISKLTLQAKATKEGEQSEMIRSLDRIVRIVGIILIPIGIILFIQSYYYYGETFKDSITSMIAAVIGMIPEGLYLLASVTLAAGAVKLAIKKVLVHDMKCIETLARVDVLCVDKTGTITGGDMTVDRFVPLEPYVEGQMPPLKELISDFAAAMTTDNITMEAVKKYFNEPTGETAESISSFSSAYKYSGVRFPGVSYVMGAPDFVLKQDYEHYRDIIERRSAEGYRVMIFGEYSGIPDGGPLTGRVTPLCLILLSNPIRKDAKETFEFFAKEGVTIKVISGDNPITVSRVALEAGIEHADNYVDAAQLRTREQIEEAVEKYTVFGRVTPNQKRLFVRALKKAGHTVAMTGDGVNDVLALKDADCSVAMASGSDAAAQASQLVLLESDFSRMPDVVMEGRQIVNNMERSGSLFIVKNIFSLLLAILSILFAFSYPLEPTQISLISMFTIGIPAFFLSQIPNTDMIKGRFFTNILLKALPAGLTDVIVVGSLVVFGDIFAVGSGDISVASTLLLAVVGFMILYSLSKPMDTVKWIIYIGSIIGMIIAATVFHRVFAISGVSLRCVCLLIVFSIITEPLLRYLTKITQFFREKYLRYRGRENEI